MKHLGIFLLMLLPFSCQQPSNAQEQTIVKTLNTMETTTEHVEGNKPSVYDFRFKTLQGAEINLNEFKGRKMLLVNVASECGFTPQYKELQQLYDQYGTKVVVIGFPANDFGGQEPGSNQEIAAFCEKNYGVTFPVVEKIAVTGPNQHPLYKYLSSKSLNGVTDEVPTWNFCKYLINEDGKVVQFFPSKVAPLSSELIAAIQK
ncbi:glutathione peroxidase [Adhaeribacter pallidiroseus]|uniref:Glutathione peroxidase n=1 Tax=Adhaeribacter pallidiroseus TaxID=2072847 RepID=A0A369QIE6_9BACT|nr:glutathione peroxidase [Adhaeribacter pallidiroseus]RDC63365.1 Glutathione peroxidase [Adhaeribacter pallidiroseus]